MNIVEATRKAIGLGTGIFNQNVSLDLYFLPTNTEEGFLCIPSAFCKDDNRKFAACWSPRTSDILSNTWEVWGYVKTVGDDGTYQYERTMS